jgi:hypothetical protein
VHVTLLAISLSLSLSISRYLSLSLAISLSLSLRSRRSIQPTTLRCARRSFFVARWRGRGARGEGRGSGREKKQNSRSISHSLSQLQQNKNTFSTSEFITPTRPRPFARRGCVPTEAERRRKQIYINKQTNKQFDYSHYYCLLPPDWISIFSAIYSFHTHPHPAHSFSCARALCSANTQITCIQTKTKQPSCLAQLALPPRPFI